MADENEESTEYREKYYAIEEVPAPDDLVGDIYTAASIKVTSSDELKRGTLLMSSGNNAFTPATAAGLASASEVCILCSDINPEGNTVGAAGYFSGSFHEDSIVLTYEGEEDDHAELIEAIRYTLRAKNIYV